MRFTNTSDKPVRLRHLGVPGIPDVAPGAEVDIPDDLAQPGLKGYGIRRDSVIESIAPQLQPSDPDEAAVWKEAPEPQEARSRVVSADRLGARAPAPASVSPGVAAARAAAKAAGPAKKE